MLYYIKHKDDRSNGRRRAYLGRILQNIVIFFQTYGLMMLLDKCIEYARSKTFSELQTDPFFENLHPENLISILTLRVTVSCTKVAEMNISNEME